MRIAGAVETRALKQSINEIVQRHEALRTTFKPVDGQPMQLVSESASLNLPVIDLTELPAELREAESKQLAISEAQQSFDLATGPLLRTNLLRLSATDHLFLISMHHIVSDGWSMGVFFRELSTLYEGLNSGRISPLPELPIQYADYAVWQRESLQEKELEKQLTYWRQQLAGSPELLELPTDRPRPAVESFKGARLSFELAPELLLPLRDLSRREGVTLFMTLLAAFQTLLSRYSGETDIVVGSPIAGRQRAELENLIGLFVNTLPLRNDLSGNPTFRELLWRTREMALGAYAHQDIPFEKLVEHLHTQRSLSYGPIFQVIFALENTPHRYPQLAGQKLEWVPVERGTSRCDLSFFLSEEPESLQGIVEFNTDLFNVETIERLITHFKVLLESVIVSPERRIQNLPLITIAERHQLLVEWNSTRSKQVLRSCMHRNFEAWAERIPHETAVVSGDQKLSYGELNLRANQLGRYLRKRGVGPEVPVGICMTRTVEMLVALLGVLKSGGAYVPLDPGYPAERLSFMLSDSRVPVLITEANLQQTLPALETEAIYLDSDWSAIDKEDSANLDDSSEPENLAYIIYTSGSTGRPKGVAVAHQTVMHLFETTRNELGIEVGDTWSVVHSTAFDFSVWEIWGCLLQGGKLIVVPLEVVQSPADLHDLLQRERVTVLSQTPAALRELLAVRNKAMVSEREWSVRLIVCGGDALDRDLALELAALGIPAWNFYGPTENTVWTTCGLIASSGAEADLTSIGRPLAGVRVYVLDDYMEPLPIGFSGELVIGGDGLARGYFGRAELTAEKFMPDPFSSRSGARLYKTGDLARYRSSGQIEFQGRADHQVKLRGFRVELGEIEAVLGQHSQVEQAVVILREHRPRDQRLVAYIVAKGSSPDPTELREFLRRSLPEFMIPSAFVILEQLPLSNNKKIDRKSLPAPESYGPLPQFIAPQNPVEEILANIWARVLDLRTVGIDDTFFELGGHSLLATQVMARIREAFQVELPLRALFESPTIRGLAIKVQKFADNEKIPETPPLIAIPREGNLPLSLAQQRLWFLDQLEPESAFYNISRAIRLKGALDYQALRRAITEIVHRHESLRTSFGEDGVPFQRVNAISPTVVNLLDMSELSESLRDLEARRCGSEVMLMPFNLSTDILLRVCLFRLGESDQVLVLTMHHIAADGWSLAILFRELTELYGAFVEGKPSSLGALPIQYGDFAVWQRQWLQGAALETLISYWKKQLSGAPLVLNLPQDRSRPAVQSFRGAYRRFKIPAELSDRLKGLSRSESATIFMTCLATFQLLLSRYAGQEDLIVGTDVANRNRVETEELIGFFTNLLPLRTDLSGNPVFTELLRRVRETTLEAYAHQELPFDKLVEEIGPPRDLSRNPLVQVLLVMQNQPAYQLEMPGLELSQFELPLESSRFDLVLFLADSDDGLDGLWLYNPDLFESASIIRMSIHFERLLTAIVNDPAARLNSLEFLTDEEASIKSMEKKGREETKISRLRKVRRRGVDLSQIRGVKTEYFDVERPLPLIVKPDVEEIHLVEWTSINREFIETNLLRHGAILFRGFSVDSVAQFERFAAAVCPNLFGEYGDLPREELGGKVYGSTPYPADETILFHNESSHMHRWPMLIWFYCVKAAAQGGESPIIDCRRIYEQMDPGIRKQFEDKGLRYVRNFTDGLDVSWQSFFHSSDRATVEEYCREAGIEFEWKNGDGLRTRQLCPAALHHPQTGEMVFFNQIQLHHISCLAPEVRESLLSIVPEEDLPRNVYYGDGSRIDDSVMEYLADLYQKLSVSFPWQKQDILMVNNMLVAHSRNPFVGERKIVVALGNLVSQQQLLQPRELK